MTSVIVFLVLLKFDLSGQSTESVLSQNDLIILRCVLHFPLKKTFLFLWFLLMAFTLGVSWNLRILEMLTFGIDDKM